MIGESVCVKCKKKFKWKRNNNSHIPKYCSNYCAGRRERLDYPKGKFIWKTASSEQKKERLKISFERDVIKKNNCWDWKGDIDHGGYTRMSLRSDMGVNGHVISWYLHKGNIPNNKFVCHTCDNRKCTNPEHLFLGDCFENVTDRDKKKRGCKGSQIGTSKLTEYSVKEIKKLLNIGVKDARIAKDYQVSKSTIGRIKFEKTWKHVNI